MYMYIEYVYIYAGGLTCLHGHVRVEDPELLVLLAASQTITLPTRTLLTHTILYYTMLCYPIQYTITLCYAMLY